MFYAGVTLLVLFIISAFTVPVIGAMVISHKYDANRRWVAQQREKGH